MYRFIGGYGRDSEYLIKVTEYLTMARNQLSCHAHSLWFRQPAWMRCCRLWSRRRGGWCVIFFPAPWARTNGVCVLDLSIHLNVATLL